MNYQLEQLIIKMDRIESLLVEQINFIEVLKRVVVPEKEFLDLDEASAFLQLKKSYLQKLNMMNEFPVYKVGRRIFYRKDELIQYIVSHRRKSRKEMQIAAATYVSCNPI